VQAPEEQKLNYGLEFLRGLFLTWADALQQQQHQQQAPEGNAQQEPPDPPQQPDSDGYENPCQSPSGPLYSPLPSVICLCTSCTYCSSNVLRPSAAVHRIQHDIRQPPPPPSRFLHLHCHCPDSFELLVYLPLQGVMQEQCCPSAGSVPKTAANAESVWYDTGPQSPVFAPDPFCFLCSP